MNSPAHAPTRPSNALQMNSGTKKQEPVPALFRAAHLASTSTTSNVLAVVFHKCAQLTTSLTTTCASAFVSNQRALVMLGRLPILECKLTGARNIASVYALHSQSFATLTSTGMWTSALACACLRRARMSLIYSTWSSASASAHPLAFAKRNISSTL